MKYTIVTNGQMIHNLSQGKCLRMIRVYQQQNVKFTVLKEHVVFFKQIINK